MSTFNDRINARIDPKIKKSAEDVFSRLGITAGEAIRMFYAQVSLSHGMPFPVRVPNKKTRAAFKESEEGKIIRHKNSDELFKSWKKLKK